MSVKTLPLTSIGGAAAAVVEKARTMRGLEIEMKAAEVIREQVRTLAGDDPDFIRDAIEGETNLREMIAAMVAADGEDAAVIDGLTAYEKALGERKERIKHRVEMRRALIASALEIAELPKLETATGTVSRKALAPKAVILNEADIPPRFFVVPPPKLDKAALTKALKERAEAGPDSDLPEIPGATLSNGSQTIQIRR